MEFEWDEVKRRANYVKHGLDLRDAAKVFQGITLTAEDERRDYGEKRFISLGLLEDVVVVVVYKERSERIRLISIAESQSKGKTGL